MVVRTFENATLFWIVGRKIISILFSQFLSYFINLDLQEIKTCFKSYFLIGHNRIFNSWKVGRGGLISFILYSTLLWYNPCLSSCCSIYSWWICLITTTKTTKVEGEWVVFRQKLSQESGIFRRNDSCLYIFIFLRFTEMSVYILAIYQSFSAMATRCWSISSSVNFLKGKQSSNIRYEIKLQQKAKEVNISIIRPKISNAKAINRYFNFIFIARFTKDDNSTFSYFPFQYGKSGSIWSNAAVPKNRSIFFLLSELFCFKTIYITYLA